GIPQQQKRLGAAFVGRDIVRVLVVDRIDLGQLYETGDVDAVARVGERDALELLVGDGDKLPFADLVASNDVLPVNDLLVEGTVPLVLDRGVALAVEETEAHILLLRGGVQFDGKGDEAEADVSPPVRL